MARSHTSAPTKIRQLLRAQNTCAPLPKYSFPTPLNPKKFFLICVSLVPPLFFFCFPPTPPPPVFFPAPPFLFPPPCGLSGPTPTAVSLPTIGRSGTDFSV